MKKLTLEQRIERLERALLYANNPAKSLSVQEKVELVEATKTRKERKAVLRQINGR